MDRSEWRTKKLFVREFTKKKGEGRVRTLAIPTKLAAEWDVAYLGKGGFDNELKVIPIREGGMGPLTGILLIPVQSSILGTPFLDGCVAKMEGTLTEERGSFWRGSTQSIMDSQPFYYSGTQLVPVEQAKAGAVLEVITQEGVVKKVPVEVEAREMIKPAKKGKAKPKKKKK